MALQGACGDKPLSWLDIQAIVGYTAAVYRLDWFFLQRISKLLNVVGFPERDECQV